MRLEKELSDIRTFDRERRRVLRALRVENGGFIYSHGSASSEAGEQDHDDQCP
jgi:hypothetical protein